LCTVTGNTNRKTCYCYACHFYSCNKAKETAKARYEPEIVLEEGKKLIPIQNAHLIDNRVVLLPTHIGVYFSEQELVEEIKAFLHTYLDINPFYENVVAYYVLMTWVFDRLSPEFLRL